MNEISETGMDMTAAAWRLERSQGYAALAEKYGGFESHMDQGRRTAFYSGFGLARKIFGKPTDAALIEEAARRGMSVMDAAEAARLRGLDGGGLALIAAERKRQVEVEGYTANHDAGHATELALAASCYAANNVDVWPWSPLYWKPGPDRKRDLVKAGALIAAALDALLHVDIESEAGA